MKAVRNKLTAILAIIFIVASQSLSANELTMRNTVMSDNAIPLEVKTIVWNEFDRHISKEERLFHDGITPYVFTLSNKSTYMIFELNSDTDETQLVMLVRVRDETGLIDFLWAKEMGTIQHNAKLD